eukprot:gnl/TRDRNA2_/TRDRNA2_164851_c0_seq2.p1 gnl/TRDRNA2_/TRDRNA2_164851_c0~~gnl/TRDRNA2_/TRDRNA2_164851_c0_seq2.p1  ORF type:complete len:268 (-),score=35.28 gnl/TRDRNA2_/TRDRNA2_164851_c0_seq2:33-836(-)
MCPALPRGGASLLTFALGAAAATDAERNLDSTRPARCRELLQALQDSGAIAPVPLEVRPVHNGEGIGVFAAAHIQPGQLIFSLPHSAMLAVSGQKALLDIAIERGRLPGESSMQSKPELLAIPTAFAVEIRRGVHSPFSTYFATLPRSCPQNLASGSEQDLELADTSLSAPLAALLRRQLRVFDAALPDASAAERRWSMCTVTSRLFSHPKDEVVMVPFLDLLNHGGSCEHRFDEIGVELRAVRALAPGDELTVLYGKASEPQPTGH